MGSTKVYAIPAYDGTQDGDTNAWCRTPIQADTNLSYCKDPIAGAWINFTALPMHASPTGTPGYITGENRSGGKIRIPTFDHPDGG